MATPQIKNRQLPGDKTRDPSVIELLTYNEKAGSRKSSEVGRALLPLSNGSGGFTTDASASPLLLPSAGKNLAVFNTSATTVYAVTVGDNTMTAQAVGAVQTAGSPTAPFVGVPVQPLGWLYLAAAQWNRVATNNAALVVFLIDDDTFIQTLPATNSSSVIIPQGSGNV